MALVIAVGGLSVLIVAASLVPNAQGMGTHTQLGMAPCGFKSATGLPCATCGMTTAFAHAANGNLLRSFIIQPAGMVLAVITAMATLLTAHAAATGMALTPIANALWRPRIILTAIAVVLAAWAYTALRAVLTA